MLSKDDERWKRLEALGAKGEISTPEGEDKMSAVIIQLAEPLLKQHGTNAKRAETIISLTVAGYNSSIFPPNERPIIEKDLIDCFVPTDGSAEDIGLVIDIIDMVAQRREKLFPDLRKVIVAYDLDISSGRLTLNVTSVPVLELG
ncbi:MAG: hypothetical protein WD070_10940 [Pirellulaceae bacterium]